MKTQISIFLSSLVILFGCSEDNLCLIGSGLVNTYEIETNSFNAITIYGPVNLRYLQADTESVSVLAEPEMFRHMSYRAKNNMLYIGYDENVRCFETEHGVWINVSNPELKTIHSEGINVIVTDGPITQNSIKIVSNGTANLELSGHVDKQILSGSGVMYGRNFDLQSNNTLIDFNGSADLEVSCFDLLDIDITGSATVFYKGDPMIRKKVEGSLSLDNAN